MTAGEVHKLTGEPTGDNVDSPARDWVVAATLFGLMLAVGLRQGGFWPADAFVAVVAAAGILVVSIYVAPPDRCSSWAIASVVLLALWWLIRAQTSGSLKQFLPLGASFLAFAAAFSAVRPLRGRARDAAGLGLACLGAVAALIGFAGLIWRWYPMAMPAQGLWRLSTTLTYSDGAGLVLGVCLLIALGTDRCPVLVRLAVCLCAGGLLATQSRGAYVAVACGCCLVPWRRYARYVIPLMAGAGLGVAAIASSPDTGRVPWLGAVLILALGVAAVARWDVPSGGVSPQARAVITVVVLCVIAGALLLGHHEIDLRTFSPSDQDRSVEWSTALHQWWTAPILGVGPDRLLQFHAPDGTYAHFAHNEFLQIAADAGLVGVALLALSAVSVIRVARRSDGLSSCATSALVCWAVAAAFDFDWHLAFVGFLGGWCLGLSNDREEVHEGSGDDDQHRRRLRDRVWDHVPRAVVPGPCSSSAGCSGVAPRPDPQLRATGSRPVRRI